MTQPSLAARALVGLVRGYQLLLSPWIGQGCRFEPTCSRYAMQALARHGAAAGSYLALARIARCHPGCAGGHDPVPDNPPRLFTRMLGRTARPAASATNPSTAPTTPKLP